MDVDIIKTNEEPITPQDDGQIGDGPQDETQVEPKNETVEILKKIDEKLTKQEPAGPTQQELYQQKRERLKEQFGWNDAQVDLHEAEQREAMAPIKEELAWTKIKSEQPNLTPEIEAEMKAELSQYPAHSRADKALIEKVFYMALGKQRSFNRHSETKNNGREDMGEEVVSRRVVSSGGSSVGLSTQRTTRAAKISEEERQYARKMKMTEEDYAKYRDNQYIDSFKKK